MASWSDEEDGNNDMVILPPENADVVTDDEEIEDNGDKIDNDLPNDVCGTIQLQTNLSEIEVEIFFTMMAVLILTKMKKKGMSLNF